jgi:hypothetical protein
MMSGSPILKRGVQRPVLDGHKNKQGHNESAQDDFRMMQLNAHYVLFSPKPFHHFPPTQKVLYGEAAPSILPTNLIFAKSDAHVSA